MPVELMDLGYIMPGLIELLLFGLLALLGSTLMKLIQWDYALRNNQTRWLQQIGRITPKLRRFRRQLENNQGQLPSIPLPKTIRRKWRIVRLLVKVFSASKWVHS